MSLDVNTLFMVTIYVEAILGLLLLFVWVQNTAIRAVAWWGFAHLIRAAPVSSRPRPSHPGRVRLIQAASASSVQRPSAPRSLDTLCTPRCTLMMRPARSRA